MFTASVVTDISLHSGRSSAPVASGVKEEVKIDFTKPNDHPILKVHCFVGLHSKRCPNILTVYMCGSPV